MANLILGYPNHVDSDYDVVTLSGGSWEPTLPLSNLRDPLFAKVARSTDLDLASTQWDTDLGVEKNVRLLFLPKHSISREGFIRVTASTDPAFGTLEYDTGWLDAWPTVYDYGAVDWGHPSWWDGKLSPEEAAGYNIALIQVFDEDVLARYWRVEVDDTGNPDGFIEVSRMFLTPGWQPTVNMSNGAGLGWKDPSTSRESLGGVRYVNQRRKKRAVRFVIQNLPEDEALYQGFEIQRGAGTTEQVAFVFDPAEVYHMHRRSFAGYMTELPPVEFPHHGRGSIAFQIEEAV